MEHAIEKATLFPLESLKKQSPFVAMKERTPKPLITSTAFGHNIGLVGYSLHLEQFRISKV
jgi:hypothetical protein